MNDETAQKIAKMNAHLSQFKEMEHRAKLRIEKLAELSMKLEDEMKQKAFADRVSELFDLANQFENKMDTLISDYEMERNRMEMDAD